MQKISCFRTASLWTLCFFRVPLDQTHLMSKPQKSVFGFQDLGPASTDWSLTSGCSGSSLTSGVATYRKCEDLVRMIVEIELNMTMLHLLCKQKLWHLIYIIVCVFVVGIIVYSLQGAKNPLSVMRKKGPQHLPLSCHHISCMDKLPTRFEI